MYELSIAAKYLTPRWRQLSVSIISLISILVIAVVVWLIVVFFSVTNGLTDGWLDKLTALTAPARITPTKAYYDSYYYLVDGISAQSDYTHKTIGEKREASQTNPYDLSLDEEIPASWKQPDLDAGGQLKDPVKLAFAAISMLKGVDGLYATEYENHPGKLHLRLWRDHKPHIPDFSQRDVPQGYLTQASIFGTLDPHNPLLSRAILPPSMADLSNLLANFNFEGDGFENGETDSPLTASNDTVKERLQQFFKHVTIHQIATGIGGWQLPSKLLPQQAQWEVVAMLRQGKLMRLMVPAEASMIDKIQKQRQWQGYILERGQLEIDGNRYVLHRPGHEDEVLSSLPRIFIPAHIKMDAQLIPKSLDRAQKASDLQFEVQFTLQGSAIKGVVSYQDLRIAAATFNNRFQATPESIPYWLYTVATPNEPSALMLPNHSNMGSGVLLPRTFRESGLLIGDSGYIGYPSASPTGIKDEQIPIFIAGFYDPGIIPIGGKYIIADPEIVAQMRAPMAYDEPLVGNGINIRFSPRDAAHQVKSDLQLAFEDAGISEYWKVETFKDYEFTKDVIQQLQSDKHLFSLLAALIIIVACSNIISMLIILVNDKKQEIGILRSMGASSFSIALIFGSCGVFIGVVGSIVGTLAAVVTLKNLQPIVSFISWLQGYNMFNPMFYGENLPTELNYETLTFVIGATAVISLLAGIIPAIKASLLKPATILKAE